MTTIQRQEGETAPAEEGLPATYPFTLLESVLHD